PSEDARLIQPEACAIAKRKSPLPAGRMLGLCGLCSGSTVWTVCDLVTTREDCVKWNGTEEKTSNNTDPKEFHEQETHWRSGIELRSNKRSAISPRLSARITRDTSAPVGVFLIPRRGLMNPFLEFGHFHCRVAASEGRPAFQGRSRQPNPLPRRGATDEMVNPNGVRDSSAADAAAKPAVRCPANLTSRQNACFMVGTS